MQQPAVRRRVLIVDDEPDFTTMLRLNLQEAGPYEVQEVNEPRNCLPMTRQFKPDVILLDVMMPELDGGDVASLLASEPATRDIPIIFLTALVGGDEMELGGLLRGGRQFVPKPISISDLVQCIEYGVQRRNPRQGQ